MPEHLPQQFVVLVGVLPHVHPGEPETEGGHSAHESSDHPPGNQGPPILGERVVDEPQIGEQLAAVRVADATNALLDQARVGGPETSMHKCTLEPIRLACAEGREALPHLGHHTLVLHQRGSQGFGDIGDPRRRR